MLACGELESAGHAAHDAWPSLSRNVSTPHAVHAPLFAAVYPALHVHPDASVPAAGPDLSAGQASQATPPLLNELAGHSLHVRDMWTPLCPKASYPEYPALHIQATSDVLCAGELES